jgi:PIN domain nuclease of toxin-antitoxin system
MLLDPSALLWRLTDSDRLSERARVAIASSRNRVFVSAASAWEIAIKVSLGRLEAPEDVASWLPMELATNRFSPLSIDLRHALEVERLPHHHTDPFDRLLIAQAMSEGLTMVTGDRQFGRYDVAIIWC